MPIPHRFLSRKLWFALAALAGLYALAGFWLVPKLVVRGLHEYLEVKHQRHVQIGAVRFNPFTLHLEADRFSVADADGQPLLGFGRIVADVRARSVLRGGVEFAYITLEDPHVRLVERRGIFPTVPVITRWIRRHPARLAFVHRALTRLLPVPGWCFLNLLRFERV